MSYEAWHWRTWNISLRIFGLMALLAGVVFFATAVLEALGRMSPWFGDEAWAFALLGIIVFLVGAGLCRRRVSRPDLGDVSWVAGKAAGYDYDGSKAPRPRTWWTGETKPVDICNRDEP